MSLGRYDHNAGFGSSVCGAPECRSGTMTLMSDAETLGHEPARRAVARSMADAAQAWLAGLDAAQRGNALGVPPADDASDAERRRWFYTPTDHGGLTFHQQRPAQQRAAMRLVSSGLSTPGYVSVATIIG